MAATVVSLAAARKANTKAATAATRTARTRPRRKWAADDQAQQAGEWFASQCREACRLAASLLANDVTPTDAARALVRDGGHDTLISADIAAALFSQWQTALSIVITETDAGPDGAA